MRPWRFLLVSVLAVLAAAARPTTTSTVPIDINHASPADLQRLPGIGPARARAIIARRDRRPYRRARELLRIRGIGRKTLRKLRPLIVVRPVRAQVSKREGETRESSAR